MTGLKFFYFSFNNNRSIIIRIYVFAVSTCMIHSHLTLAFSWCFLTASSFGASSTQKQTLASLLKRRSTCATPNSSLGDAHNSWRCCLVKGTLWVSINIGILLVHLLIERPVSLISFVLKIKFLKESKVCSPYFLQVFQFAL